MTPPAGSRRPAGLRAIAMTEWRTRMRPLGAAALIALVFLGVRYWLATTNTLSETYYDEALTGLVGLAILRGTPEVFLWGQPYLGAVGAYVAAAGFWLAGSSSLVLRMAAVTAALCWAWSLWSLARRISGEVAGLRAGLWIALPPVFLSFAQLSAHEQSIAVTLGTLVLAAGAALLDDRLGSRGRQIAWVVLGAAGGLGWWASQMMGMFLVAAALVLVVVRPRVLRERGPYAALALFFVASLPFWVWNVRHEWATFRHLASWGEPLPTSWLTRIQTVCGAFLATLHGTFWDGRDVAMPAVVVGLGWVVVATAYVPAVALAGWQVGVWGRRLVRRERPWHGPLDVVVLAFWLTLAAHLLTWFGTSGVLRYSMTFYATVPALGAVAISRIAGSGRSWRVAAAAVTAMLLIYNGMTHVAFVRDAASAPWRPVDQVIQALTRLGVRACYADSRIAQVITFESAERIVCADYHGLRNYAFLQAVDAVDNPATVAIVTHRVLETPPPPVMERALALVAAARATRTEAGDHVIFHHIQPPDLSVRPIDPAGWQATASVDAAEAPKAFDRKVWTHWSTPEPGGWLQLDFGREHRLVGLSLLTAPLADNAPVGLKVAVSLDGQEWDVVADDEELVPGMHWWKGHPRFDESGRVLVRMTPRPTRYVRLSRRGAKAPGWLWSIGELFAYQAADSPWTPPAAAARALEVARGELAHWMDDPQGPHPKRAPVTYVHRRAQVQWRRVFAAANEALETAPEWEEAHHLYGSALDLAGWRDEPDAEVAQAREDQAWPEVLRWADLATTRRPDLWRSGREAARADALQALGRPTEAAAVLAAAERRAVPQFRVRFGDILELIAIEVPAEVRRGEEVTVRYVWRALGTTRNDYTSFVHIVGPGRLNQDHRIGALFGTAGWSRGERVEERLPLRVPATAPPGLYQVRAGVWLPATRVRLRVTEADRPHTSHVATVASFTVRP